MKPNESIFLLGGRDLEMQEIASILSHRKVRFFQQDLRWDNAKLSAYAEVLQAYAHSCCKIYGVELVEDIAPPSNYYSIDHHNHRDKELSSIEQVACVLNIELDYRQQLIAANDKFYIKGMKALGATDEEIACIRYEDRKAQGVTESDEQLARYALNHFLRKEGKLVIVKTKGGKFSPISDALYPCEQVLIYTDKEWTYYGTSKNELVNFFKEEIALGQIYHGGGDSGYIGLVAGIYPAEIINHMIQQIKEITNHV